MRRHIISSQFDATESDAQHKNDEHLSLETKRASDNSEAQLGWRQLLAGLPAALKTLKGEAAAHTDPQIKLVFLNLKRGWLLLARSYDSDGRLTDFSDAPKHEARRRRP